MHGSNFLWFGHCQWLNFHAAYDSAHALPIIVTIRDLEIHGL